MEYYIEAGNEIVKFIKKKYGSIEFDNFVRFFQEDFFCRRLKLTENDIKVILEEIDKLVNYQRISFADIKYLGSGQSFGVIQVGYAVVKIGKRVEFDDEIYRLPPIHETLLKESNCMLYVSQMANGRTPTYDEMLDFYKKLKEEGSLWLDPKVDNLGFVDHFMDFKPLYGIPYETKYKGPFLVDYEDVLTVNSDNRLEVLYEYGSPEDKKYLYGITDIYAFYYQLFIRKRSNLLEVEKQIALREDNFQKAHQYEIQQTKNFHNKNDYYSSGYYDGDMINYPPSAKLERDYRRQRIIRAKRTIKEFFQKEKTPKH